MPLAYKSIKGLEHIDKVIEIDQSPIGRTPGATRQNLLRIFTEIRIIVCFHTGSKIRDIQQDVFHSMLRVAAGCV